MHFLQRTAIPNFNSIKVRLEQAFRGNKPLLDAQFQFHKGTIRTFRLRRNALHYVYFNSIKVRLEHPFL